VVDLGLVAGVTGEGSRGGQVGAGSSALIIRCLFGTVSVALRTAAGRGEGLHCVAPAGSGVGRQVRRDIKGYSAPTRVPVYIAGAPGEPSPHVATFARLPAPRPAAVVFAAGGRLADNVGVGGFEVEVALESDHPAYPAAAVWSAASLRCAVSGIPSPSAHLRFRGLAVYGDNVVSCQLAGAPHAGFAAISVLLDGADAPALADLTPVAQLLVPGDGGASFTTAVGGGPACGGGGGGAVWLAGGNLLQYGVGGSWDDRSVGGFGWGTGSGLMCRYTAAGDAAGGFGFGTGGGWVKGDGVLGGGGVAGRSTAAASGELLTHTSSGDAPAHVVSSALAVCEAPVLADPVLERADDDAAAAASVSRDSSGLIASARVTSGGGHVSANASAFALRVISEPTLTSVSPLLGLKSGSGAVVFAAWRAAAGLGRRPAPPQLACAFGTIAPVALVLHGSGMSGGGTCVSPAHAPTPSPRHIGPDGGSRPGLPIRLHLPNSGRTPTTRDGTAVHAAVIAAPTSSWVLLPSATSAGGGAWRIMLATS